MFSNVKDWRCGHELEEIGYIMFEILEGHGGGHF